MLHAVTVFVIGVADGNDSGNGNTVYHDNGPDEYIFVVGLSSMW